MEEIRNIIPQTLSLASLAKCCYRISSSLRNWPRNLVTVTNTLDERWGARLVAMWTTAAMVIPAQAVGHRLVGRSRPSSVPCASSVDELSIMPIRDEARNDKQKTGPWRNVRRAIFRAGAVAALQFATASGDFALADVRIALSNMQATSVPCPEGQTTVTGGTSFEAACFRVTGDATNPATQPVYNADIFGRVYDAQGESALDANVSAGHVENLRIDTIKELPPGKSKVSFQITVNEEQAKLGPLELKNFKATGYLGKVNNQQGSGRFDDIDFSELDGED